MLSGKMAGEIVENVTAEIGGLSGPDDLRGNGP